MRWEVTGVDRRAFLVKSDDARVAISLGFSCVRAAASMHVCCRPSHSFLVRSYEPLVSQHTMKSPLALLFLFFFALATAQTPSPTERPTEEPTATGGPTISGSPAGQPSATGIVACFRKVREECNCGLFFAGSKCWRAVFDDDCDISGNNAENRREVRDLYTAFCENA